MKFAVILCRSLLGLAFLVAGANVLFPFLPTPPIDDSLLGKFRQVMEPTGYIKVVGFFQFAGGILILSGRMLPLGLAFLAPVLVNILAVHIFLMDGQGILPGLVFSMLEAFLIFAYRDHFLPLFSTNAQPTAN